MAKRQPKVEKVVPPVETPASPVDVIDAAPPVSLSFESPESSLIVRAEYDSETETMLLTLRAGLCVGKTYRYSGIPLTLWTEFEASSSKGRFFSARIRPSYIGRVVAE